MRWYRIDTSIKIPRYPSPASEPDESLLYNPEKIELDYKHLIEIPIIILDIVLRFQI